MSEEKKEAKKEEPVAKEAPATEKPQAPKAEAAPSGAPTSQPASVAAPAGAPTSQPASVAAPAGAPTNQPGSVAAPAGAPTNQPGSVAAPAAAQADKKEELKKKEKPSNCAGCNKSIKKKRWYYRDGKYYCTKRCWNAANKKEAKKDESEPAAA